jgi:hypothetical protein
MKALRLTFVVAVLASFVPAALAANKTTLEFDLTGVTYVNNKEVKISVPKLNKTLAQEGLAGLPERIVVSATSQPYHKVLMSRIEAANKVSKTELRFVIDGGFFYEFPEICYRGEASEVPEVLKSLAGTFWNADQGILAFRYGKKKLVEADQFKTDAALKKNYEESDAVDVWLNYDTDSDAVLLMCDLGPEGDGTELYAIPISPCPSEK